MIAYHKTAAAGDAPGVVFCSGYGSDMTGTKACFLEQRCAARGLGFLRFDYTGHGASSGRFEAGCIGDWASDAEAAIAALTEGQQILVGSSMGGWISCLLIRRDPDRFAGFIGIAAAPDFTEELMAPALTDSERTELAEAGMIRHDNPYGPEPTVYTNRLFEDGARNLVLRAPLPAPFPVRLLHGTADADVPVWLGLKLLDHIDSPDARITLTKGADHRFSEPRELAMIEATLEEMLVAQR